MTGRGRPPIGERIVVRFPAETLAAVDAIAEREQVPRAEIIRRLVKQALG